ncbi:MAG: DMT family transporter [Streptosporangiaceae bacterium]
MVAVLLAVVASFLYALSAAAEQRAVQRAAHAVRPRRAPTAARCTARHIHHGPHQLNEAEDTLERGLKVVRRLLSSPLWLAGWGVDALGYVVHAAALHLGSIATVQPLIVTTLLFTLPLSVVGTGRRPSAAAWAGVVAVCVGLAAFVSTRHPGATGEPNPTRLLLLVAAVVVVAAMLVAAAGGRSPVVRAGLLATAAGSFFSLGATCTKLVGDDLLEGGVIGTVTDWPAYVLIGVSVIGLIMQQDAFAAGPLPVAMTALTITDPVVSYIVGVVGFSEHLPTSTAFAALAVLGALVTIGGVYLLAHNAPPQPAMAGSEA